MGCVSSVPNCTHDDVWTDDVCTKDPSMSKPKSLAPSKECINPTEKDDTCTNSSCASSVEEICTSSHTPDDTEDFHAGYVLGKRLGRGNFAQVRLASLAKGGSETGEDYAVKIVDLRTPGELEAVCSTSLKFAHSEGDAWKKVSNHKHIVRLHEIFLEDSFCYFVMERCSTGLFRHLASMAKLDERSVGSVFAQMFHGLSHVHSVNVVHRDVKPDNFLVGGDDGLTVKLGDFGLSAMLPKDGKLKERYGTAPFMCPEMLTYKAYNEKADIWSMAVLVYGLLFGDFPYLPKEKTSKGMRQAIVDGKTPVFQPSAACVNQMRSESALEFVKTLLNRNPEERPSAKEALELPFLNSVIRNEHMIDEDLPSFRSVLYSFRKSGGFETFNLTGVTQADFALNKLQLAKQGKTLPDMKPVHPDERGSVKSSSEKYSKGSEKYSKGGSFNGSRLWRTMSFGTTAFASSSNRTPSTAASSDACIAGI